MGMFSFTKIYNSLSGTKFVTDNNQYLMLKLSRDDFPKVTQAISDLSDRYIEIILDKDELTLIVSKQIWDNKLSRLFTASGQEGSLGVITCEVTKPPVTGYLFAILSILSTNNIGVYVQGAYTTDHIFVDYSDLNKSVSLLNQLKSGGV